MLVAGGVTTAVGWIAGASWIRRRVAQGDAVPCTPGCVRGIMCSARRVLRILTCGTAPDAAADRRRLDQDEHLATVNGAVDWCFYGGAEFATWDELEVDLSQDDALLPVVPGSLNCGLDGATVTDLIRHSFALVRRHRATRVVLSVGDGDYDAQCTEEPGDLAERCGRDVVRLVDQLYEGGVRDVRFLLTPDPPGASDDRCDFHTLLADRLDRLCRTFDRTIWRGLDLSLLDFRRSLGRDLARMDNAYMADGMRPGSYAHQLKGDLLREALGK